METAVIALLIILILVFAALFWSLASRRREGEDIKEMQSRLDAIRAELNNSLTSNLKLVAGQLSGVTGQVAEQLTNITMQIQSSTGQINQRMDSAARMVGEVRAHLGELSKATEQIYSVGKDIAGLQDILRAPKLRGGLGEFLLSDLLSQCLPSTHYDLQYTFRNGARVDAVVRLSGGLVPIDSKFPLENFRKVIEARGEEEKKAAKRRFVADCKKHIDAIASSYILPAEGTFGFALMYIPAENVYYEAIVKDEELGDEKLLSSYAFSKKVVPVSPNSFYAYLQTILLGLRGMEISARAEEILAGLETIKNDYDKFMGEFETLGRHINNTKTKYDELEKKAGRLSDRLSSGIGGVSLKGAELSGEREMLKKP